MLLERQAPLCQSTWAGFDVTNDPIEVPTPWLPRISPCPEPLQDTRALFQAGALRPDQIQPRARQLALDALALEAELGY